MFSKLLGKKVSEETDEDIKLVEKIAKMDLSEMRLYVNGKLNDFKVCELGLHEVLKKLMSKSEKTSKYYITDNDMDSKRKKVLDLLLLILKSKHVSVLVIESAQEFLEVYEEMITKYDFDNKEIYMNKIKKKISNAVKTIGIKTNINEIMSLSR